MFFASRKRRGHDFHLDWKVRLFFLGAFLAIIGIGMESDILILAAIAILLVGALLRFLPGGRGEEPEGTDVDDRDKPASEGNSAREEDPA